MKPLPIDFGRAKGPPPDQSDLAADVRQLLEKPGRVLCGDIDIRIDAKGQWFHEGGKINRKGLVNLFSKVLYRDDDGGYWMVTPAEVARIIVEDAPFVGLELIDLGDKTSDDEPIIRIRTNVDDIVPLDDEHPIRVEVNPETGEPRPYIVVRGRLEALIARSVFYQLVEESEEIEIDGVPVMGVWSSGVFFPLGSIGDAAGARP
ncbi:MAG: DUF1285 domain-containing protein [Rhodospirillales bacterium]